jgi:predicted metal-dependent peptidase
MLHLALRTHDRSRGSERLEFNYAHDYIINDILRDTLGVSVIPAGGLDMPGAKERSAEDIVLEMRRNQSQQKREAQQQHARAQAQAQRGASDDGRDGDVLDEQTEREMFPGDADDAKAQSEATRARAARALSLARAMGALANSRGVEPGGAQQVVDALRGLYRTPWEMALQRWLESVAPGERTFTRASRRGAERTDVVMPGRRREGWILNVVLDTSGSMTDILSRALGAIADFCDALAVEQVRVVQCDAQVTADDLLTPFELARRTMSGYGGSDLTPALDYLAADPQVRAVLVLTDGDVEYPRATPPFDVLWVVTPGMAVTPFAPPYGRVLRLTQS